MGNEEDIKDNMNTSRSILVKDRYDNYVFLFENEFATRWFEEKFCMECSDESDNRSWSRIR